MKSKTTDKLMPFTADLHIHSALSPCAENNMKPNKVLKKIISLGIDTFSITDHNSGFNCAAFKEAAKKKGIIFIPGIELQSIEEIHLLGYFPDFESLESFCNHIVKPGLTQWGKNDPQRFGNQLKINSLGDVVGEEEDMLSMPLNQTLEKLVDQIHDYYGIAVAAHLDKGFSVISHLGYIPPELKLDAVEIIDVNKMENIRSNYFKDRDFNVISSSDSHYLDLMKPPNTKLWVKKGDVKNCLDCIKGEGSGKITHSKKIGRSTKSSKPAIRQESGQSKKDWKGLYE